jgi:outer membrane lipoprotein-sorting protein
MSMMSALIPLALAIGPQAAADPTIVALSPSPAPVVSTPAAKPVDVKFTSPAPVAKPTPAVAKPGDAQLIKIQAPAAMDRNAIIDRVARALTDTRTAQGRFTQVDPQGSPSSGVFYINRPGKVRFEYTSPEPIFIVSDGTSVSIEEPKRKSYDAVPLSSTPLNLFLRSNIDLKKDGSVSDVATSNGSYFVTLVDKTGEAEGKMILQFRQSDFELMGWRQIDGTGAETRVQLADVKKNVTVKPALFIVKDPADIDDNRR